ncbi:hypothetical protein ACFWDI_27740 [Streptomyces sp. NPDC060064]|uniref:hypothetical protein n=1 Tax=Streptomyces sp. NPDC060064 TaxID=3347049 RepID=UPI00369D8692
MSDKENPAVKPDELVDEVVERFLDRADASGRPCWATAVRCRAAYARRQAPNATRTHVDPAAHPPAVPGAVKTPLGR